MAVIQRNLGGGEQEVQCVNPKHRYKGKHEEIQVRESSKGQMRKVIEGMHNNISTSS